MKYTYKLRSCIVTVYLNGDTIEVEIHGEKFYATYPINIEDTEKDLIDAMIWILFQNYNELDTIPYLWGEVEQPPVFSQKREYENSVLLYSGGMDSTAILQTFDTTPIHLLRSYDPVYSMNQLTAAEKTQSLVIQNNMELIGKYFGKKQGFNIGFGYTSLILPLVDKYKIGKILFGVVYDDIGFYYGDPFVYNGELQRTKTGLIFDILRTAGIEICFPFAGLSEVWTTKIVDQGVYSSVATSCHTRTVDNICRACFKCFRKQGILGKQLSIKHKAVNQMLDYVLHKKPLKMAASTIYGIQKAGYRGGWFDRFYDIDVGFLDRWNPATALIYNSNEMMKIIEQKMDKYDIKPQTQEDAGRIERFVETINNDKLYE